VSAAESDEILVRIGDLTLSSRRGTTNRTWPVPGRRALALLASAAGHPVAVTPARRPQRAASTQTRYQPIAPGTPATPKATRLLRVAAVPVRDRQRRRRVTTAGACPPFGDDRLRSSTGHRPDRLQRDEVPAHPRPSNPA